MHSDNGFQCTDCDFTGRSKDNLYYHKIKEHTLYVCTVCQKEESSKYMLDKHYATHSDKGQVEEEPSACNLCDFVGLNKRSLQYHQKKHKGEIFACDKCEYTSPTITQLRSHSNSKHGERKFKCQFCELKFKANWILKQHMDRKHLHVDTNRQKNEKKGKPERRGKADFFESLEVKMEPDINNIVEVEVEPDLDNMWKEELDFDIVKVETHFNSSEAEN